MRRRRFQPGLLVAYLVATVATLVVSLSPDVRVHPGRLRGPGVLLWTGLVWALLVAVPMLLARTVGARILVLLIRLLLYLFMHVHKRADQHVNSDK